VEAGNWRLRQVVSACDSFAFYDDRLEALERLAPLEWFRTFPGMTSDWLRPRPDLPEGESRSRIRISRPTEHRWYVRFNRTEREHLRQLASSQRYRDRRLCVEWLRSGDDVRANVSFVLELAEGLAKDPREEIRSPALSVIGEQTGRYPHKVWPAIERLSRTRDRGFLMGLAAFLLEHLLGAHHGEYLARVRVKLEAGDWRMAYMLSGCWQYYDQSDEQYAEVRALVEEYEHLLKRR
jgi:hypothetical protein